MMGTDNAFVRHGKVSSSLDFPPGKSDEQRNPALGCACSLHIFYAVQSWEAGTWLTQLFLLWHFSVNWPFFFRSIHLSVYYTTILQYHLEVPNGIRVLQSRCSMQLSSGIESVQPEQIKEEIWSLFYKF